MATGKSHGPGFLSRIPRFFTNIWRFLKDVYSEMQRVVWPSHEETYSFTAIVLIAIAAVGVWVASLDLVFAHLMVLLGISK